jgi:hypothetical protein
MFQRARIERRVRHTGRRSSAHQAARRPLCALDNQCLERSGAESEARSCAFWELDVGVRRTGIESKQEGTVASDLTGRLRAGVLGSTAPVRRWPMMTSGIGVTTTTRPCCHPSS